MEFVGKFGREIVPSTEGLVRTTTAANTKGENGWENQEVRRASTGCDDCAICNLGRKKGAKTSAQPAQVDAPANRWPKRFEGGAEGGVASKRKNGA